MDVIIPDSWLKEFLDTAAKPQQIADYLSLCGPSVERMEKIDNDWVYHIEVTTNRVDSAGVWGVAREAAVILPRFGIEAKLINPHAKSDQPLAEKVSYLDASVDHTLCPRFTTILIRNIKLGESPQYIQQRLKLVGLRPINNVVDISNYLMHELGQPVHTFDYDKITAKKMVLRASKAGEKITTLDGKSHKLPGGDIVIEDGSGRLIDLAGIMGGGNSAVDNTTKNVLLFVQTYNPVNIRKTSMSLAHRTEAVSLFEKGLDPELVEPTIRRGIDLLAEICNGEGENVILDIYPKRPKLKTVKTDLLFINELLGIELREKEISEILESLGFKTKWQGENLEVAIPSWRSQDVEIPEDIVEEVARIYGYHNFPSQLMTGPIPDPLPNAPFEFEIKVKQLLKGWGGVEVYTLSLVSEEKATLGNHQALKLRNPLGADSEYLRTTLLHSIVWAAQQNNHATQPFHLFRDSESRNKFHLFEMSNVYLPRKGDLPEEKMMLAGIFSDYNYERAKGIIEGLMDELHISPDYKPEDKPGFIKNHSLAIFSKNSLLGMFGVVQNEGFIYYELDLEALRKSSPPYASYKQIPKYPPQIEDLTLNMTPRSKLGDVIDAILSTDKHVINVELIDSYEETRTLRITYQSSEKTLTNQEVKDIRSRVEKSIRQKFNIKLK